MDQSTFDIIVIGGGPGGYVAAIRAAQLGQKVALVEHQNLGGICLNWGCIPTKALLKSSHLMHMAKMMPDLGIHTENVTGDIKAMVARSRSIAAQLERGVASLLKSNGVHIINAFASFSGEKKDNRHTVMLHADGKPQESIYGRHVIVSTGARARQLFPDVPGIWSSKEAMTQESVPSSLLVIGAGAIGVEFASFYQAMGTKITMVEMANRIVPAEDAEISALAAKAFQSQGMDLFTEHTACNVVRNNDGSYSADLTHTGTKKVTPWHGDAVLVAIGVVANTANMGIDKTGITLDKNGHIETTGVCETGEPGIYAIGDVAGMPWLAHKASHEGIACVDHIVTGKGHAIDPLHIPGCVYSAPQIASIGLCEEKAAQKGDIKVGRFPFAANGQALAQNEPNGLVKVIFDKETGELLGAHMIGHNVSELIHGFAIAKTLEATEDDLKRVIFPHPTLSEMIHEAILDADKSALHIPKK